MSAIDKSRAQAREFLQLVTGTPMPEWRACHTDFTDELTGFAPVCPDEQHDPADRNVYDECCPNPVVEVESGPLAAYLVELLNADRATAAGRPAITPATPLFLAEFHDDEPTVHLSLDAARAHCDALIKPGANGRPWDWSRDEDGVYVQVWTHPDDDRPTGLAGGQVTETRVQHSDIAPSFFQPDRTYTRGRWTFHCLAVAPDPTSAAARAVGFLTRTDGTVTAHALGWDNWMNDEWAEASGAGAR